MLQDRLCALLADPSSGLSVSERGSLASAYRALLKIPIRTFTKHIGINSYSCIGMVDCGLLKWSEWSLQRYLRALDALIAERQDQTRQLIAAVEQARQAANV